MSDSTQKELQRLRISARDLVAEIDKLEGVAELPYGNAVRLASATDAVRVSLGEPSVIRK